MPAPSATFLGKSGAILLGFPDTTQDAHIYAERSVENCRALAALREHSFALTPEHIQLKNGPFDLDLILAPDGIEHFEHAWRRRVEVAGFPVCHIDDIVASKAATNRQKNRESLPRPVGKIALAPASVLGGGIPGTKGRVIEHRLIGMGESVAHPHAERPASCRFEFGAPFRRDCRFVLKCWLRRHSSQLRGEVGAVNCVLVSRIPVKFP